MLLRSLLVIMALMSALSISGCGIEDRTDLEVTAPKTDLRVGETVQLSVTQKLRDGSTRDLTSPAAGTVYYTTSESMLIPETDGKATCIGTDNKDRESAVIGVVNGKLHGHIRFHLISPGPGPGLEVIAEKTELREGDRTQLHVFKVLPDGSRKELTDASSSTRYLTFAGGAMADSSVVSISNTGLVSAAGSIGSYNYRTVIVFVRNEDSVGWIQLKVVPARAE
jgi:hypothetical protein